MRIAKADSPSEQISQVISELTWTHYKATGKSKQYMYWRTAANAVFSDTLVIFGTGDSSGAWGVLFSEDCIDAEDISDSEFMEHRPEGWTTEKVPGSRYAKITHGILFSDGNSTEEELLPVSANVPRSEILRETTGEILGRNALRTNVKVKFKDPELMEYLEHRKHGYIPI